MNLSQRLASLDLKRDAILQEAEKRFCAQRSAFFLVVNGESIATLARLQSVVAIATGTTLDAIIRQLDQGMDQPDRFGDWEREFDRRREQQYQDAEDFQVAELRRLLGR